MLAGVDEAGRGPVLGPLVVAAVMVENDGPLREVGVKDSKLLTPARREELAAEIRRIALRIEYRVVGADELNRRMPGQNLNEIEVDAFAELLSRISPREAIVDACDVVAERFGRNVAERMGHLCPVLAEHEADARHPVVAAASILAKTERDRAMRAIAEEFGDCGSGYPHDDRTREWLADYVRRHERLPPFARREWETAKRLLQRDLTAFLGLPTGRPEKGKPKKAGGRSPKR